MRSATNRAWPLPWGPQGNESPTPAVESRARGLYEEIRVPDAITPETPADSLARSSSSTTHRFAALLFLQRFGYGLADIFSPTEFQKVIWDPSLTANLSFSHRRNIERNVIMLQRKFVYCSAFARPGARCSECRVR
jgi:hypothetical protein